MKLTFLLVAIAGPLSLAQAQFLMAPEITNDDVMLFDATTGVLVNPSYIDLTPVGGNLPIEAIQVNNEIWVTDQNADSVFRFSLDGTTHLGTVTGGMDNIRGIEFDGTTVYVCNSGTGGGAPNDALIRFDTNGTNLGFFAVGDPFDVINYNGNLMVSNILGDDIDVYSSAGTFLSTFHNSDGASGVDFPQQIALRTNGNVIVAGFTTPAAIYEYDPAGVQISALVIPVSGGRGVFEMPGGKMIYSDTTGVNVYDPSGPTTTNMSTVQVRYFGRLDLAPPAQTAFCFGDGSLTDHTTPCPCGNNGAPGNGCGHSFDANGANLGASGVPANDDVVLHSQFEPVSSFTLFMQHENTADTTFHDGVLCAGNPLIRLRGRAAAGGEAFFPNSNFAQDSTTTLSQRGGVFPGQGVRRYYAAWYRNASTTFCPPATANVTNGWQIDW
jgi:hypothetical protein